VGLSKNIIFTKTEDLYIYMWVNGYD